MCVRLGHVVADDDVCVCSLSLLLPSREPLLGCGSVHTYPHIACLCSLRSFD